MVNLEFFVRTSVMVISLSSAERLLRQFSVPLEIISLPSSPRKNEYSHSKQVLNFLSLVFFIKFNDNESYDSDHEWNQACLDQLDRKYQLDSAVKGQCYHQLNHCSCY